MIWSTALHSSGTGMLYGIAMFPRTMHLIRIRLHIVLGIIAYTGIPWMLIHATSFLLASYQEHFGCAARCVGTPWFQIMYSIIIHKYFLQILVMTSRYTISLAWKTSMSQLFGRMPSAFTFCVSFAATVTLNAYTYGVYSRYLRTSEPPICSFAQAQWFTGFILVVVQFCCCCRFSCI